MEIIKKELSLQNRIRTRKKFKEKEGEKACFKKMERFLNNLMICAKSKKRNHYAKRLKKVLTILKKMNKEKKK